MLEKIPDESKSDFINPDEFEKVDELKGKTGSDPDDQRLMHSVLEHDNDEVKNGKLLSESIDYNLNSFQPDLMFEQLVKNYQTAKKLFGPTLIRELTGYDDNFVEKNIKIPEFQNELKNRISQSIEELKKNNVIDKEGKVTKKGIKLSALIRYVEELDALETKGIGKQKKEKKPYGERTSKERYKKGVHHYKDIDLKRSVKLAIRRGHNFLTNNDLIASVREEQGNMSIIYALDSSGSMRGEKIKMAKQAGVALTYKALQDLNKVGIIIFTSKIEDSLAPTNDFLSIIEKLSSAHASLETDMTNTIEEAIKLFSKEKGTKHLVLLTDALPNKIKSLNKKISSTPQKEVLKAVSMAKDSNITISLVGISLDEEGERLAKKIVEISNGKLYRVKNVAELDAIILEDYESLKK